MRIEIKFHKYQGTGNDFVMINNMSGELSLSSQEISAICDRRFGIGADGLILIEPDVDHDFYVNYYNSDGSQSFCGNGSRCSVLFASRESLFSGTMCTYNAIDGVHSGELLSEESVMISLKDLNGLEELDGDFVLDTGSPHYVKYCNALENIQLVNDAREIRYNQRFKTEGINVNFVEAKGEDLMVRTYERGVEDETLSCGTGVTAVALSSAKNDGLNQVNVVTKGGKLSVAFVKEDQVFSEIRLTGPASCVYVGIYFLEK